MEPRTRRRHSNASGRSQNHVGSDLPTQTDPVVTVVYYGSHSKLKSLTTFTLRSRFPEGQARDPDEKRGANYEHVERQEWQQ